MLELPSRRPNEAYAFITKDHRRFRAVQLGREPCSQGTEKRPLRGEHAFIYIP